MKHSTKQKIREKRWPQTSMLLVVGILVGGGMTMLLSQQPSGSTLDINHDNPLGINYDYAEFLDDRFNRLDKQVELIQHRLDEVSSQTSRTKQAVDTYLHDIMATVVNHNESLLSPPTTGKPTPDSDHVGKEQTAIADILARVEASIYEGSEKLTLSDVVNLPEMSHLSPESRNQVVSELIGKMNDGTIPIDQF